MNFKMKMARTLINVGIPVLKYFKPDWLRRSQILKYHGIDLLFDVGANAGQYGEMSRMLGYKGKIVSFEPVTDAYQRLEQASAKDSKWTINRYALGDVAGKQSSTFPGTLSAVPF